MNKPSGTRVNTSGHPSADELLAAVAAIDNPDNAGAAEALTRPPTAQTPNPLRWRSVDDDDASLLSKGLEIDSRLRYHRHRAEKVGCSLGDDASILSVRRGRDALKRERASQVDLRRQEQARARRRGDFPEVRRIQGMIDEINDEATFVNVDFAADEGVLRKLWRRPVLRHVRHLGYRWRRGACCEAAAARRAAAAARAGSTTAAARRRSRKTDRPPDAPARRVRGRGPGERAEARAVRRRARAAARPDVREAPRGRVRVGGLDHASSWSNATHYDFPLLCLGSCA